MSNQDTDRKIAVIFATDVVGYSKHMEKDEDATLASLNECNKIIEPIIKKQKGRIFNTGGDSVEPGRHIIFCKRRWCRV